MLKENIYKNKIKLLLALIFIFVIIPLGSAVPPFQTSTSGVGFDIAGIDFSAIKTETARTAVIGLFNSSNGVPITSGASCIFRVYSVSDSGALIFTNSTPLQQQNIFYFSIPNSIYNKTSEYTRLIQCNSSIAGGFYKSTFRANVHGEELSISIALFYIFLAGILIIFLVMTIASFVTFDNLLNRVAMFGLSYLLLIAITFIGWNMASDFISNAEFVVTMLRILFLMLVIGAFPVLVGAFAWYIIMLFKVKEIDRLMNKGMDYSEAERRSKH